MIKEKINYRMKKQLLWSFSKAPIDGL